MDVRFEVYMVVKSKFVVSWVTEPCSVVVGFWLEMEAAWYSKMVSNHYTTTCNNPENRKLNLDRLKQNLPIYGEPTYII
jgi:hypothetical protein